MIYILIALPNANAQHTRAHMSFKKSDEVYKMNNKLTVKKRNKIKKTRQDFSW